MLFLAWFHSAFAAQCAELGWAGHLQPTHGKACSHRGWHFAMWICSKLILFNIFLPELLKTVPSSEQELQKWNQGSSSAIHPPGFCFLHSYILMLPSAGESWRGPLLTLYKDRSQCWSSFALPWELMLNKELDRNWQREDNQFCCITVHLMLLWKEASSWKALNQSRRQPAFNNRASHAFTKK